MAWCWTSDKPSPEPMLEYSYRLSFLKAKANLETLQATKTWIESDGSKLKTDCNQIFQNIEAKTKPPTFYWQLFQMHFLEWISSYLIWISLKLIIKAPVDKTIIGSADGLGSNWLICPEGRVIVNSLWPSNARWRQIWVNIGSGNGLLLDGTKPLPEPMLTDHQWSQVTY